MPRIHRCCPAGEVFHVLNRAVARMTIFEKPEDYDAFLRVLNETWAIVPLPILAFIAMPNHWHFVVRPTSDDQVSEFFRRLTVTHTMRWHAHYHTGGSGHLYQGRFKSFPVQADEHLLTVMRYAERNALRAGLAARSEDWRWGTLHLRSQPVEVRPWLILPSDPNLPRRWIEMVNRPQSVAEVEALRRSVQRGTPFGSGGIVESCVLVRRRKAAYPVEDFTLQRPDAGTGIRHETDYDSHPLCTSRRGGGPGGARVSHELPRPQSTR